MRDMPEGKKNVWNYKYSQRNGNEMQKKKRNGNGISVGQVMWTEKKCPSNACEFIFCVIVRDVVMRGGFEEMREKLIFGMWQKLKIAFTNFSKIR